MSWFYRDNKIRAAELNTMAYLIWNRRSKDIFNKLEVRLANPNDRKSPFIVLRGDGTRSEPIKRTKQVQKYIRRFYNDILYESAAKS